MGVGGGASSGDKHVYRESCCGSCDDGIQVISMVSEGGEEGDASLGLGRAVGSRSWAL